MNENSVRPPRRQPRIPTVASRIAVEEGGGIGSDRESVPFTAVTAHGSSAGETDGRGDAADEDDRSSMAPESPSGQWGWMA